LILISIVVSQFIKPHYFYAMNSVEPFSFIITFLLGGVIVVGTFIILVVLKSTLLKKSRYFLVLSLLGLIQHLCTYLLFTTQLIKQWPHLLGVGYSLLFIVGPCFYFFIKSYGQNTFRLKKIDYLHFVPFLILLGFYFPRYFDSAKEKLSTITYYYEILPNGNVVFWDWFQVSLHLFLLLGYSLAALLYLHKNDKKNSLLLKRFCWLLVLLAIMEILLQTGFLFTGASAITSEIILSGLMSVTILLLGYWIVDIKQILPVLEGGKYKTSPLSEKQSQHIQQQITVFFDAKEPYLNPNLKIADLSKSLNVPSHHISQVLSERMQTNFYEVVNLHRVQKAKKLLCSKMLQKLSIQAIGQECGFSSKSSFYRSFKRATDMTPAQFVSQKA
jgi:AraC-like DNA-binding protein